MTLNRKINSILKSFLVIFILCSCQLHAQLMPSLIGDANDIGGDCFEITENINNQSGAVWSGTPIDMTSDFVIEFRGFFGTNDANGADGIVFILKNNPTPQIGNLGGGMGYEGIGSSLAVEFDTWQNNDLGDPFFDHLAIISTGVNNHNAGTNLAGPVQASATTTNIEDGAEHIIRIEWTAVTNTLDVYFDCALRLSYTGDVVNNIFSGISDAYFGFTGSTGGAANLQRVCFDYVSFANSLSLNDQNICSGNIVDSVDATVTGATTYTWTPIIGVSNPTIPNPTFSPTATTTYTVSITNSCAEIIQESFTITIDSPPVANSISDFAVCDDLTNDGAVAFNFTNLNSDVLGTQDSNVYDVSYHLSLSDAIGNLNPLTFPYTNTDLCEQIFVRVQNNTNVSCYDTTSFEICVNSQPNANQPNNMVACDVGNDGTEVYNLALQEPDILGTQNAADVNITFHASQVDALNDANPLPIMHTGSDNEFIFIRVESTEVGNDCFAITSFQLFLNETPIANPVADINVCDDSSNDDIAIFDFTTLNTTVLGTQDLNQFSVTYYTSQLDADNDTNALTFPYTNTTQCEQIFVRIENDDNPVCYETTDFQICVNTQPIANQPNDIILCDIGNDGTETFNLSLQEPDILGTQNAMDFNITFHAAQLDAINDVNPLPTMHTGSNNEIIFVRIESTEAGNDCIATTSFQLLLNEIPIANTIADFNICDDDSNDGVNAFDFTNLNTIVLGTLDPSQFSVNYYPSQTDADDDTNALMFPYTNMAQCERIYVRIENDVNTTCFDTTSFEVCVNTQPIANQPNDMIVCDFDNNGTEIFDLSLQEPDVLGTQNAADLNITFHNNQFDADNNVNPLSTMYNGSNAETVFVRIESTQAGNSCYDTTMFDLLFDIPPIVTMPSDLIVCDDEISDGFTAVDLNVKNAEIVNNQPGFSVQYYLTQTDANNDLNPLTIPYTNTSNPQTVYVRVETGNLSCFVTTSLVISVEDAPTVFPITPLEYCDTDNDGFGIFDIRSTENQVTGGVTTNIAVTYHETPEDADNNVNVLADSYTNINAYNQTIYVRVENVLTGCFNVVPLDLIVHDSPEIAAMDATLLAECDADTDGIAQFDLTQSEPDILNGEDPLTHNVRYYNTQANAIAGTNAGEINNTNAYSNIPPSPQIIWVRVEDLATGCFTVTNLTLIVNELPTLVQLSGLELCDAVSLNDGVEVFDLTSLSEDLLNSAPGISLDYYANMADLASDTPIANPSMYSNTELGVQTIFVKATNDTTGCENTITFDISVNPLPSPTLNPNGMLVADICDEDNDGFQLFDLDDLVNDIINNEPDVVYSFHETLADAQQNLFPLASPYTNIMMDSQEIYVLATNTITGCFTVTPLQLTVTPIPVLPLVITDIEACDDADSLDGFDMFDLTQTQTEIYGTQTPSDFTLSYHESQQDAADALNPIVNLTDYTNIVANQQTIWVRLEDNTTECFAIGRFDIIVVGPPVLVQPIPFALCDDAESGDDSDELTTFDLTEKYLEITGGDTSLTLAYYANATDLASDTPIVDPTAYQNVENPQTLYIRATNSAGCTTDITMTLRVLPIPTPNTMPEPLTQCDDDADGILVFDLTLSEAEIVNNENNVTVSYHTSETDAMDDTNAIVDPTMHSIDMATANTDGEVIIYVRVESDLQIDSNMLPCYKVVALPVIVHPLPVLTSATFEYVFCEYDNDNTGQFEWDVVTASLNLLEAPQDLAAFTVTYHPTVADALAGTAALVNGFENATDPQTVFIRVENIATECINSNNIASLELSVEPIPTATAPNTYELCADDQTDQDTATFDLTSLDTTIINGQADMEVVYYESATDADMDSNSIANASTYVNMSNPQTLYARVRQTITGCLSDPILVNLQVNPLPVFTLPAADILCVDATGQALDIRTIGVDFGAGYTYQWTTPSGTETTPTVQVTEAGTYSVTVTDMNHPTNCTFDDSVTYTASSAPTTLDIAVNTPAFSDTHTVTATASGGSGSYEYQLDDGQWQIDGIFTDLQPGQHTITVRDSNGCGELVRTFGLIDFMEFFTPNGDAYNPTWNIIGLQNQPAAKIYIFDRYGKLLKQISPAGAGWDGTYNGTPMPSADYWFRVEYVDPFDGTPKEFINHFTLKR